MQEILKKFDEAKGLAEKAIAFLNNKTLILDDSEKLIKTELEAIKVKKADLDKQEKKVKGAKKLLMTQDELEKALGEAKETVSSLSNQEKAIRSKYAKKENELISREGTVVDKEKELTDGLAKLAKDKKNYKEKIIKEMASKLGGE